MSGSEASEPDNPSSEGAVGFLIFLVRLHQTSRAQPKGRGYAQTGSVLLFLPFFTVLGFKLYNDTGDGRAATHQLFSSTKEFWYTPMHDRQTRH